MANRFVDEIVESSPVMQEIKARMGDRFEEEMSKPIPKSTWAGGFRPNRKARANRVQTHLALAYQETDRTEE